MKQPAPRHVLDLDRLDGLAIARDLLGREPGRPGERGHWWHCPFHADRNPSFKVYQDHAGRWFWKCHGCGKAGTPYQFVQAIRPGDTPAQILAYLAGESDAARTIPFRPTPPP